MKKFLLNLLITLVLSNFILSNIYKPEPTMEEKLSEHIKKLGYNRKMEYTKDEFILIVAKFFPKYANVKDTKTLRQIISRHFNIEGKVSRNDLFKYITDEVMKTIIREEIDITNKIDESFDEHFDKIDAEFKDDL